MKYKTLFRLLIKVIGVWLFAEGVLALFGSIIQYVSYFSQSTSARPFWWIIVIPAQGLARVGLGAYLFFGGRWIVDKAIPSNRPYCHECGYELSYAESNRCPECGTEFKAGSQAEHEIERKAGK